MKKATISIKPNNEIQDYLSLLFLFPWKRKEGRRLQKGDDICHPPPSPDLEPPAFVKFGTNLRFFFIGAKITFSYRALLWQQCRCPALAMAILTHLRLGVPSYISPRIPEFAFAFETLLS